GILAACSTPDRPTDAPVSAPPAAVANTEQGPLDAAIAEHWRAAGVEPTATADDAEFLRRASLDLVGRIPTADEVQRFTADERPDKRAALVDDLLADDAWAEHWAEVLGDTLLGGAVQQRPAISQSLGTWIERQLAAGAGWDDMTTAMLTASGGADEANPAGFVVVHGRKNAVEALTGQTARVFLGLQLQCAQCHDDPDDRFTQQQFYGLAAYYARTRARQTKVDGVRVPRVVDKPRGEMRMPTEHDAPGDRSGARVAPAFPALVVTPRDDETRRQTMARGIVGSPLFAKAAANHAWARLMGRGVVEPWDDLGGLDLPEHPAILETLAEDFIAHDYDLRHLLRTIVMSRAYQRSSAGQTDGTAARERVFAQSALRPMSASQLLRSLLVATGLEDTTGRGFRRQVARRRQQLRKEYAQAFDDDEMAAADTFSGNVPQALLLLNGELTNQGVTATQGALAQLLASTPDPGDRIDALYLRVYGRPPSAERREALRRLVAERSDEPTVYQDLMHAMLASSEFVTIH
ncbi:MAG: DUF1549 and DUF1553 domain-containing protein, partial [Deltaproteobacteria bacterium]|nr:DUF1549 and DUF1553 domain-containing protein [Deltaproteobacteria bacterium]